MMEDGVHLECTDRGVMEKQQAHVIDAMLGIEKTP